MGQAREVMDRLTATIVDERNPGKAADLYADGAILVTPDAGEVKGREDIAAYWRTLIDAFPDAKYEPVNTFESGSLAVDEGYLVGTHGAPLRLPTGETLPATGNRIRSRSCDIGTVAGGKIVEHHLYFDQLAYLDQLGISP